MDKKTYARLLWQNFLMGEMVMMSLVILAVILTSTIFYQLLPNNKPYSAKHVLLAVGLALVIGIIRCFHTAHKHKKNREPSRDRTKIVLISGATIFVATSFGMTLHGFASNQGYGLHVCVATVALVVLTNIILATKFKTNVAAIKSAREELSRSITRQRP